jgi:hypothetical protein
MQGAPVRRTTSLLSGLGVSPVKNTKRTAVAGARSAIRAPAHHDEHDAQIGRAHQGPCRVAVAPVGNFAPQVPVDRRQVEA